MDLETYAVNHNLNEEHLMFFLNQRGEHYTSMFDELSEKTLGFLGQQEKINQDYKKIALRFLPLGELKSTLDYLELKYYTYDNCVFASKEDVLIDKLEWERVQIYLMFLHSLEKQSLSKFTKTSKHYFDNVNKYSIQKSNEKIVFKVSVKQLYYRQYLTSFFNVLLFKRVKMSFALEDNFLIFKIGIKTITSELSEAEKMLHLFLEIKDCLDDENKLYYVVYNNLSLINVDDVYLKLLKSSK